MNIKELYEMECLKNEEDIQNGILYNVAILIKGEHVSRFKFDKTIKVKNTNVKGVVEKQLKDAVLKNGADAYIVIHHGVGELGNVKTGERMRGTICARTLYTPELKLMNTIAYKDTTILATDNWDGRQLSYDPYDAWNITEPVEIVKVYKQKWENEFS